MGLDIIQGDHEDAPSQVELKFRYDDALRTCDRLTTCRQTCAEVAREFGLIAVFMSKPYMWRGGEDSPARLVADPLPGMDWDVKKYLDCLP